MPLSTYFMASSTDQSLPGPFGRMAPSTKDAAGLSAIESPEMELK
ncbi:MAG TPA: hypothetical protein VFX73_06730 [Chitinophagaceae bacterium]|nr:hypothetical protein [Chitinophagaceae bacterium]